jgi:hypothetical protein
MQLGIIAAAALTAASAICSATGAQAEEWCGYATHANSVIECGYTSVAECENAVGKGGMCFVDPERAFLSIRKRPAEAKTPRNLG